MRVRIGLKGTQAHELHMTAIIREPDAQGARRFLQLNCGQLNLYSQAVSQRHNFFVRGR